MIKKSLNSLKIDEYEENLLALDSNISLNLDI